MSFQTPNQVEQAGGEITLSTNQAEPSAVDKGFTCVEAKDELNQSYWESRYTQQRTGWDVGTVSRPIKEYIDQLQDKTLKILIPGAGNADEAGYLWTQGFQHVFVLDLAAQPLEAFQQAYPDFPSLKLMQGDFFDQEGTYDMILAQTFFCAIDPELRPAYVQKASELLRVGGKLVGVLWNKPMNVNQQ